MSAALNRKFFKPDYDAEQKLCYTFLNEFSKATDPVGTPNYYMRQIQNIKDGLGQRIEIYLEDLEAYFQSNQEDEKLIHRIKVNTKRYVQIFSTCVDEILPHVVKSANAVEDIELSGAQMMNHYRLMNMQALESNAEANQEMQQIPAIMQRNYDLAIVKGPETKAKLFPLRSLKSELLGQMIQIKATVVRVSDVKPQMEVASYFCNACGYEIYQEIKSTNYTPLVDCKSVKCLQNRTRGKLQVSAATSKFIAQQEIKIQETSDMVPIGNIPRAFNVIARGGNTRQCSPGDLVVIQGIFLPNQADSWKGRTAMIHETHIEAMKITREKKKYTDFQISIETEQAIRQMRDELSAEQVYNMMSKSICPEIYGMEDVKKALLLQMVGGSTMKMHDDMKIRGDINVALIGDPGLAKSQLLKYISYISPRAIYTTGKGSSGVGLTAAVMKDPVTNELTLEGGALVLSDKGICCIDEFDKMDDRDKTAIHEVMEQQTVSIAKAGITTSLNARTSILAAANPSYGRYNKSVSPSENINMPAALLSRFDLIFLLLDNAESKTDQLMSQHILFVHKFGRAPQKQDLNEVKDSEFLRAYISEAKTYVPTLHDEVKKHIISEYVQKRKNFNNNPSQVAYTTPRTLLGIIRLAQAHAKLRFSNMINEDDVKEALRLMEYSQQSVHVATESGDKKKKNQDSTSAIYQQILKVFREEGVRNVKQITIEKKLLANGYLEQHIQKCLNYYDKLAIWTISEGQVHLS